MKADLLTDWLIGLTQGSSPFFSVYRFLIQTTIYLSVTALFIILFKLIFKNRIRAKWHFLIWIILLIRLAVPILPSSPVSVFNAAKVADVTIVQSSYYSYAANDTSTVEGQDDGYTVAEGLHKMIEADQNESQKTVKPDYEYGNGISETTISQDYVSIINIDRIVIFTWMGGAVLLLLYFVIVYPDYLFLDTTLDESYKEFLAAQKGVTVLYKKSDLSPISNMDYEGIYADDSFQVFRSKQSLEELRESVLHQQPDDFSIVNYSDNEFTVNSWQGSDNILFSKEIYGVDGKRLDDTYVIASQQRSYRFGDDEIYYPYPYHMTQHSWILSETADGYNLSYNFDPFESSIILKEGDSVFTDLIRYYENNSCEVTGYEGGNLTGGIIFVTLDSYSGRLFRILVAPKDDNTFTMRFWKPGSPDASYAETVIRRYISAANEKDVKVFVDCFEEIDERAADDFLAGVKSCSFHNAEIFWIDEEQEKYIFKVSYRLITEDGKTIGSYGTGKMDLIEYFTVSTNNSDHEPLIVNKLGSFADCIHELSNNQ